MTVKSDRLLLVEGSDEVHIVTKMLEKWRIEGIQTIDLGGKYSFKTKLETLLSYARSRALPLSAIGVIRDADDSPKSALESVGDSLRKLGLPVPPLQQFVHGCPSVGIFIMPDGKSRGSIEHLCWAAVEATAAAQCSNSYLKCLRTSGALKSKNNAKTLVHTYLAAQKDPVARVGEGALKGYWPFDHPAFDSFKDFASRLAVI